MKKTYIRPFMKLTLFEGEAITAAETVSGVAAPGITAAQVTQNLMVVNNIQEFRNNPNSVTTVKINSILSFNQ